ncbi:retrovirus-related pol polyprotein from transposon TNT 1-94 [Tanacetum coccineum]
MKVKESLNVTFNESPPPTNLSPLVDDDVGEEEAIRKKTKVVNTNNEEDESIEIEEIVNIKESKNHPLDQFEMSMMGELNVFLGLQIKQMEDGIFFNQSKYIKEMLKKFRLEDSKPTKTPMSTKTLMSRGTKMPSEYQQDYKKTRSCALKIYNDPNMSGSLTDIYRALKSRYVHEGRTIDPSFYNDRSDDLVAKFTAIGFNCLLSLDEQIYPRFIFEFYKTLKRERDSNNHFSIQFVINNHHFNLSLAQFAELTYLPNQGICLPALDDIRNLIHRRTVHEKADKEGNTIHELPNQIETNELFNHLRPCELVIRETVYSAIGNRDHTQAIIALMLYCLENDNPSIVPTSSLRGCTSLETEKTKFYLMAKQPKKPLPKRTRNVGKSKRTQLSTSSSTESPPSDNGDLPSTKLSPRSYSRALKDDPNMSKEQKETREMLKNLG